jgi:N-methylhydantoinase A/oxoprolinase/acetone carboxylase beta subunit
MPASVADALGITRILIHPLAGVLSAYGMGLADIRAIREEAVEAVLEEATVADLATRLERLSATAMEEVKSQAVDPSALAWSRESRSNTRAPTVRSGWLSAKSRRCKRPSPSSIGNAMASACLARL